MNQELYERDEQGNWYMRVKVVDGGGGGSDIGTLTIFQKSAANAALNVTIPAPPEGYEMSKLGSIDVVISGAAATVDIIASLKEGSTVLWEGVIGQGAPRGTRTGFTLSIPMTLFLAGTLEINAGGADVVIHASVVMAVA